MYLDYGFLDKATYLALELIDGVCGRGKEHFGLKARLFHFCSSLHLKILMYHDISSPLNIIPHGLVDSLLGLSSVHYLADILALWCTSSVASVHSY